MRRLRSHLLVLSLVLAGLVTGSHDLIRNWVTDARFALLPREASGSIVLVAIDPASLDETGIWPWPRGFHAEVIERLHAVGVSEIAFDVDFSSASERDSDQRFVTALRAAGGSVILPSFKQWASDNEAGRRVYFTEPLVEFRELSWPALVSVPVDADGLVRRYLYGQQIGREFVPSLGAMLGGQTLLQEGSFLVDYSIRPGSIPVVSFIDVLRGDEATLRQLFAGRKAIIGATALELGDRVNVPGGKILPGVMLQVVAAESILQGRALQGSPFLVSVAGGLIILLLMVLTCGRLSYWQRAGLIVGVAMVAEAGAVLWQNSWPLILDTSILHLTVLGYLASCAISEIDVLGLLRMIAESRFQRIAMSVGDGLICVDGAGRVTLWNPGAAEIFGFESREIVGKPVGQLFAEEDGSSSANEIFSAEALKSAGGKVVELCGRRRNGELFPIEARLFELEGRGGGEYGALLRDISLRKRHLARIQYLAETDSLTGLANRHTVRERLNAMLERAAADHAEVALLVLDLDRFKDVNDSMGHTAGDDLLAAVADRLSSISTESGLIGRLGGDEFAVLVGGKTAARDAELLAKQIDRAFRSGPFRIQGRELQTRCSIGIAIYPTDGTSSEDLLSAADLALYEVKAQGGGSRSFFTQEIKDALATKIALQGEIERALSRDEFELFYQPQVSLPEGKLIGAEALIRWRHPERGLMAPGQFMPAVHSSAFSNDVAWWVMETACKQGRKWEVSGRAVCVGVNLSPSQFQQEDFMKRVAGVLNVTGLSPRLLELEVTEDILLSDDQRAGEIFVRLREAGVRLSFDDFGTGYGSLSYLKKYPFDRLKIDRSFVRELRAGSDDAAIVGSTVTLGKMLGLEVIAEGIENAATIDLLSSLGCDQGQGYFFGRPAPVQEFELMWISAGRTQRANGRFELAVDAA